MRMLHDSCEYPSPSSPAPPPTSPRSPPPPTSSPPTSPPAPTSPPPLPTSPPPPPHLPQLVSGVVVSSCRASIDRLQCDYIDQLHWPIRDLPLFGGINSFRGTPQGTEYERRGFSIKRVSPQVSYPRMLLDRADIVSRVRGPRQIRSTSNYAFERLGTVMTHRYHGCTSCERERSCAEGPRTICLFATRPCSVRRSNAMCPGQMPADIVPSDGPSEIDRKTRV